MNKSFFATRGRPVAVAVALLAASAGAQAAVTYQYSGPAQYYSPGGESPWSGQPAGRFTGAAVFDDAVVTSTFTGTVTESAFSGNLSGVSFNHGQTFGWPPLAVTGAFFFSFVNGQVTNWFVGGAYGDFGGGGEYYSGASGDGQLRYRVGSGIPGSNSLAGTAGIWTREGAPSPVPLPLSLPLLAMGMAGLGLLGGRKKS